MRVISSGGDTSQEVYMLREFLMTLAFTAIIAIVVGGMPAPMIG